MYGLKGLWVLAFIQVIEGEGDSERGNNGERERKSER